MRDARMLKGRDHAGTIEHNPPSPLAAWIPGSCYAEKVVGKTKNPPVLRSAGLVLQQGSVPYPLNLPWQAPQFTFSFLPASGSLMASWAILCMTVVVFFHSSTSPFGGLFSTRA